MLVLSRKKGEMILINNNITLQVLEIRGDTVRLGIEAPREIPIIRSELLSTNPKPETKPLEPLSHELISKV
jgi:carbon storage regulator